MPSGYPRPPHMHPHPQQQHLRNTEAASFWRELVISDAWSERRYTESNDKSIGTIALVQRMAFGFNLNEKGL